MINIKYDVELDDKMIALYNSCESVENSSFKSVSVEEFTQRINKIYSSAVYTSIYIDDIIASFLIYCKDDGYQNTIVVMIYINTKYKEYIMESILNQYKKIIKNDDYKKIIIYFRPNMDLDLSEHGINNSKINLVRYDIKTILDKQSYKSFHDEMEKKYGKITVVELRDNQEAVKDYVHIFNNAFKDDTSIRQLSYDDLSYSVNNASTEHFFVLYVNDTPVCITESDEPDTTDTATRSYIAVSEKYRSQGYGKLISLFFFDRLRNNGYSFSYGGMRSDNDNMKNLSNALGVKIVGHTNVYYVYK